MFTSYFKSPSAIARYLTGLAGPYLDRFISWLENFGYQRVSIRRHVREVVNFATWAEFEGLCETMFDSDSLVTLRKHLTEEGLFRATSGNHHHIYQRACVFILFLKVIGLVSPTAEHSKIRAPPLFFEFCDWMKAHRDMLEITLASYRLPVSNLLQTLGPPNTYSYQMLRAFFLSKSFKSIKINPRISPPRFECFSG